VYLYYTSADPVENRVVRVHKKKNGSFEYERLLTITASDNHNGGVIHFGPDGKLYVVTGENYSPDLAQDLTSNAGKILRINKDGSIPDDNPIADSPVFSYGHRNSFGFTFNPFSESPEVWMTENGPSCNDELNVASGSENFGWGAEAECPDTNQSGDDRVDAAYTWESVIAPTGIVFCDTCHLGLGDAAQRTLLVGSWNNANILAITLNDGRETVSDVSTFYQNGEGILGMLAGPNGRALFSDKLGIYRLTNE
jgi:glucose/arabinose dehydrogenase